MTPWRALISGWDDMGLLLFLFVFVFVVLVA